MITLAFAQMIYYVAIGLDRYGGDDGLTIYRRSQFGELINLSNKTLFYYLCFALLLATVYLVWRMVNSRFGLVIQGARSNDRRMRAIGFPTFRYKLVCFVIAGVLCGLAGVLLANHTDFISPAMMHWTRSGDLIVMAVLGGMGTVFGPVIGAVALLVLEEALPHLIEIVGHLFTGKRDRRRAGILAAHPRADAAADRAVRARRHRRPASRACAVADALLQIDGLTKRFGGVVASDDIVLDVDRGRAARHHRAERRRQDHADRPARRRDRAERRPHPFRRPRHHRAAGAQPQPARAGALVPDHLAVSRFHRARQRRARGAGACRPFVPLLARCAQRERVARAGARGARARRPRRPRRRAWSPA